MGEAFIKKYPKYCIKCNKHYPGPWKECTVCKIPLVWTGLGYALHWIRKIVYWGIVIFIIGSVYWWIKRR
jgi:Ni,Fe-hydrogenase I cytochrome b subunit